MRYTVVKVKRSEAFAQAIKVGRWEVPILRRVHGSEDVQVLGEVDVEGRAYPTAHAEYQRLADRYGRPEGSSTPYVQEVYGIDPAALGREIEAVSAEAEANPPITVQEVRVVDPQAKGYLEAEQRAIEEARKHLAAEKAQARKDIEAHIEAERKRIEAEKAELAAERERLAREREELDGLLNAAAAAEPPAAIAEPISE